jgi:opacity protein-like surface antigen
MKRVGRAIKAAFPGLLVGTLLAAPLAAQAGDMAHLDIYYIVDSTLEFDFGDAAAVESDDGDGFGVKLSAMLGESVFLAGEYQSTDNEFPNATATAETARIGLGYKTAWPLYVLAEYVSNELKIDETLFPIEGDEDGWAGHIGLKADVLKFLTLDARVGYLDVGDSDGLEYVVGLGLNLDRNFGLFADYRVSALENDDVEATLEDIRAGLRFRF